MIYKNIRQAIFLERPNRFIAYIKLDGVCVDCHVKNTGRCKELLKPGANILVQMANSLGRKTPCDLIAVWKGNRLINMDSQAPNKVFSEYLSGGGLGFIPTLVRPECTHGDSRFDFYFEHNGRKCFAEIKGVTLEENSIARFPDAPTQRGVKHLHGLIRCTEEGYDAYAVFIIQMRTVKCFEPNWATHPLFGETLREAQAAGVHLLALKCDVLQNSISIHHPQIPVPILL